MNYINKSDYLWGTFIRAMFDFAVDSRNEGSQQDLNDKGLVTNDRQTKKDSYYLYKANWSNMDKLTHIIISRYAICSNSSTYVKVYSNCDSVELFVNDVSLGSMTNKGSGSFETENIELSVGDNNIKAIGTINGLEYTDNCVWTRAISTSAKVQSSTLAIDSAKKTIIIDGDITLSKLKEVLLGVNNSTYKVYSGDEEVANDNASILAGMEVRVTAEDGVTTATYSFISANLCVGKTVTATSSETSKGNIAENAVDANSSTRWVAVDSSFPQSITVDLGEDYFMGKLTIDWDKSNGRYYKYKVETSSEEGISTDKLITIAENINDGDLTNRWTAYTNGGEEASYLEWVGIDLGEECEISDIELNFETKNNRVYTYQVYVSNDIAPIDGEDIPKDYKRIVDKSTNTEKGGHYMLDCGNEKARYVIVKILGCDKWSESAKYVAASVIDKSLKNLKVDYLDMYFCHRYDPDTPIEETL